MKKWLAHLRENPVVVTGMGVFTAAGRDVDALWQSVASSVSPAVVREVRCGAKVSSLPVCAAPEIDFTAPALRGTRKMDRSVQMAHIAALQAWTDAGFDLDTAAGEEVGIVAGTSRGPVEIWLEAHRHLATGRMPPTLTPNGSIASLSGALAQTLGARGPCFTVSATCASSAAAIVQAAQQIVIGAAERVLAGGAEAPLNDLVLAQSQAVGMLGTHADPKLACRPFDVTRNGTILGEGAAFLVLESLAAAQARGARIHARLAGWALGSEGASRTGLDESGDCLERIMRAALAVAGISPGELDYINAHGTGTALNDPIEASAIARLSRGHRAIPVSSTKAVTGHCVGAAAATEALVALLALQHQSLPPTLNCLRQDPACPVDLVLGAPRRCPVRAVMSNSIGFWGNTASLVFAHPSGSVE